MLLNELRNGKVTLRLKKMEIKEIEFGYRNNLGLCKTFMEINQGITQPRVKF